jgi:hypothetical protein
VYLSMFTFLLVPSTVIVLFSHPSALKTNPATLPASSQMTGDPCINPHDG